MPSGSNHSPTLPPSPPLQHAVLILVVTHTKEPPGWSGSVPPGVPMLVMITVSPDRYTVSLSVKYSPAGGGAAEQVMLLH